MVLLGEELELEGVEPWEVLPLPWVSRAPQSSGGCMQRVKPEVGRHAHGAEQPYKTGRGLAEEGSGMWVEPAGMQGAGPPTGEDGGRQACPPNRGSGGPGKEACTVAEAPWGVEGAGQLLRGPPPQRGRPRLEARLLRPLDWVGLPRAGAGSRGGPLPMGKGDRLLPGGFPRTVRTWTRTT